MEDNSHIKYYNSKHEEVPSVTTILKLYGKNLSQWANWLGFKRINVNDYLNSRANYGTYVHSVAEKFFNDNASQYADLEYINQLNYNKLINKLTFMKDTLSKQGYEVYTTELVMHGEKYGGTADIIFYNKDKDKYLLLDFKTSKAVYRTMFMQLAGYTQLIKETNDIDVSDVGIILIEKDITDKSFSTIVKVENNTSNLTIFNHLLDIYYLLSPDDIKYL